MQNLAKTALHCVAAFALAALPLFASAATPEETFKAQTHAWGEAYNTGDPANAGKIVAMYADDGMMMPPDAPAAAGHDAMMSFITKDMAGTHAAGLSLRMEDGDTAGSAGDMGWHSGTFSVVDKDGKAVATGKFVEVWKKVNGKWLILRDIWNNDAAATAMPAAPETAKQ